MKRMLLGSSIGRLAISLRDSMILAVASHTRLENLGMLANDQLGSFVMVRLCQPNKTFVDIGAHIGSVVSEVAHHCPSSKIIAIEAIPEKIAHLRRHFPFAEFHSCALSDAEGEATFFVDTAKSGFSSLDRPSDSRQSQVVEIKVPLKTLDGLVSGPDVDVMKIDVEGGELAVLRGGDRLIAQSRPTIFFESGATTDDESRSRKESLWQWLADRDYATLVPNRLAHLDPGLSRDGFMESHLYPRRTTNYFAVAKERRVEIRTRVRGLLKLGAS